MAGGDHLHRRADFRQVKNENKRGSYKILYDISGCVRGLSVRRRGLDLHAHPEKPAHFRLDLSPAGEYLGQCEVRSPVAGVLAGGLSVGGAGLSHEQGALELGHSGREYPGEGDPENDRGEL